MSTSLRKRVTVMILTAMLVVMSLSSGMCTTASAATMNKVDVDGVTYSFYTDGSNAILKGISDPDSSKTVNVPSTLTLDGVTYNVTEMSVSPSADKAPNIAGLVLPNSLTKISGSFRFVPSLTDITIPGSVQDFTATFQYMKNLTSITFEEGIKDIASNMMVSDCEKLTTVHLPQSVTSLSGPGIFRSAPALKTVTLPANLTYIANSAFSNCTSLESIHLPSGITELSSETFASCTALKSVTSDSKLTKIGNYAFSGCTQLTKIPDLDSVSSLGSGSFNNCDALACDVDLSSATTIPASAFKNTSITGVKFSDSLTKIGQDAFRSASLTSLSLPDSVKTIERNAFYNIPSLTNDGKVLSLPQNLTTMDPYAFYKAGISEYYIDSRLTTINANAFMSNANLKKVVINNSEDDVNVSGSFPANVEVVYLVPSIGNTDDKISEDPDALTLQEAVNQAKDGEVITISKSVRLSKTLNIPEGKNITIASEDGKYVIAGARGANLKKLIEVNAGAEVIFKEVTINGKYNEEATIAVAGKTTMAEGALLTRAFNGCSDTGIIDVKGDGAEFYLKGGKLSDNFVDNQRIGVVSVTNGGKAFVESGIITGNTVTDDNSFISSAGVFVGTGGHLEMSGGEISDNTGIRGVGVMLLSYDKNEEATFVMTGGKINNNIAQTKLGLKASGAVHLEGNVIFTMKDGEINHNTGENGAGVCAVDPGLSEKVVTEYNTRFVMEGGSISYNKGNAGAGIYSFTNGVDLRAGLISYNEGYMGGGVYSEGNEHAYSTLHMENAVITDNHSGDQGGGLWFCPTGDGKVYVQDGGMIWNNTADGAGDDVASVASDGDSTLKMPNRILGGAKVRWYKDGAISHVAGARLGATVDGAARYSEDGDNELVPDVDTGNSMALKAQINKEAASSVASTAKLRIVNNTASSYGGGVGSNGGVELGNPQGKYVDIPVKKSWNHGNNPETKQLTSVEVELLADNVVIDTMTLSADTNWEGVFEDLPEGKEYTVREKVVPGYASMIEKVEAEDGSVSYEITNTYAPKTGSLEVSKTITGLNADDQKAFTFTVTLDDKTINGVYGDMLFKDGIAIFKMRAWESRRATGLPAGIGYTVVESDNEGYTVTVNDTKDSMAKGTIPEDDMAVASFNNDMPNTPPENPPTPEPKKPNNPPSPEPEKPTTPDTPNKKVVKTVTTTKTGDERSAAPWMALVAIAGAAMITVLVRGRSRDEK